MNCLTIRQFIQKTQDIFFSYSLPALTHVNTIAKPSLNEIFVSWAGARHCSSCFTFFCRVYTHDDGNHEYFFFSERARTYTQSQKAVDECSSWRESKVYFYVVIDIIICFFLLSLPPWVWFFSSSLSLWSLHFHYFLLCSEIVEECKTKPQRIWWLHTVTTMLQTSQIAVDHAEQATFEFDSIEIDVWSLLIWWHAKMMYVSEILDQKNQHMKREIMKRKKKTNWIRLHYQHQAPHRSRRIDIWEDIFVLIWVNKLFHIKITVMCRSAERIILCWIYVLVRRERNFFENKEIFRNIFFSFFRISSNIKGYVSKEQDWIIQSSQDFTNADQRAYTILTKILFSLYEENDHRENIKPQKNVKTENIAKSSNDDRE